MLLASTHERVVQRQAMTAGTLPFWNILKENNKMKAVQVLLIAVVVACASAFAPVMQKPAFKPLAMSKAPEPSVFKNMKSKDAAAVAAFATALAPFAAHATEVDEATIIGYGAGLVACVVSLAVGFAIGYGTLVKP